LSKSNGAAAPNRQPFFSVEAERADCKTTWDLNKKNNPFLDVANGK